MYLLYYLVNLINYIFFINLNFFNKFYLIFNKFNLIFKKPFKKITFFEKFILVFFYENNWFFKSISNFSNYSNFIKNYKYKNYPLLNFFSFYNILTKNKFEKLLFLKKIHLFFKKSNFNFNKNFIDFLIIFFFLNKKYFNFLNKFFFKNLLLNNLLKLNFLFFFFNKNNFNKSKKNFKLNLKFYNDWYIYTFNNYDYNFKKINFDNILVNKKKIDKILYLKKSVSSYNFKYNFSKKNNFFNNVYIFSYDLFKKLNKSLFKNINFNSLNFKNLYNNFPIRFSNSSINKYINSYNSSNYSFFYLRKNKIFNKGRYSRNRQLYRTGVYWCLWLNIIIVYGLYFFFYRFTFNFGYVWLGVFIIIFSTIFSRIVKYKFYNFYTLCDEFFKFFLWLNYIFKNFIINFYKIFENIQINNNLNLIIFNYKNLFFYNLCKLQLFFFLILNKKKDYGYVYIWKNYSSYDKSFMKYKSITNWFTQFCKVLVY